MKFVDNDYMLYDSLNDLYIKKDGKKINSHFLLKNDTRLKVIDKKTKNVLFTLDNIQSLYLYPLSILDYYNMLDSYKEYKPLMYNIIKFNDVFDYNKFKNNIDFNYYKNTEIELCDDEIINENTLIELLRFLKNKETYVSLNIKTIKLKTIKDISRYIDYFKISLPKIENNKNFKKFIKMMNEIGLNKTINSVINVKGYLNVEDSKHYEELLNFFNKIGVDFFQISKELIPYGQQENVFVPLETQKLVRRLEKENCSYNKTIFKSVRDISTLFYPRFELNESNSKNCYACLMKPYIYGNYILPCKVRKMIEEKEKYCITKLDTFNYKNNKLLENIGNSCDDCASIFENDLLDILNSKKNDCFIIIEVI